MDIILALLKKLVVTLSPTDFLLVIAILCLTIFFTVRFILSKVKPKGGLLGLLTRPEPEDEVVVSVNALKDELTSGLAQVNQSCKSMVDSIDTMRQYVMENEQLIRKEMSDLLMFRRDFERISSHVNNELLDIKHQMKMHDVQDASSFDALRELLIRGQELMVKTQMQLEKFDEFARVAVPEFRTYHKDISKDISELGRDIALVERTIQNQMSNVQNITLR